MEGDKEVEEGGGVDGLVGRRHRLQQKYEETESCGSAAQFLLGAAINAGKADEMEGGGEGEIGLELELEEKGGGVDLSDYILDNGSSSQ